MDRLPKTYVSHVINIVNLFRLGLVTPFISKSFCLDFMKYLIGFDFYGGNITHILKETASKKGACCRNFFLKTKRRLTPGPMAQLKSAEWLFLSTISERLDCLRALRLIAKFNEIESKRLRGISKIFWILS